VISRSRSHEWPKAGGSMLIEERQACAKWQRRFIEASDATFPFHVTRR